MPYVEDEYLLLSGIQHFVFCRRQWALMYIENQWNENIYTIYGQIMHEKAHDHTLTEKRGDLIIARGMPVFSSNLGVYGICDVIEFRTDDNGVTLFGRKGKWLPSPVEYKSGSKKINDADRLQLCTQAICIEDMLACPEIHEAYIYYVKTRQRETVKLTDELRACIIENINEMRVYKERCYTPRVKTTKSCLSCSLKDICLPCLNAECNVDKYIKSKLNED